MRVTDRDVRLAAARQHREWVKTEWDTVEELAASHGLCYSTWYHRVKAGKSAVAAASYPPCPIKGRKMSR